MDTSSTTSVTGLARTKSDQLLELIGLKLAQPRLVRKPSQGKLVGTISPGGRGGGKHIRKSRSDEVITSGAALSRASSLGFSFSLAGFTAPSDDFSDPSIYSEEENAEEVDNESRIRKKIVSDPTSPISLKFMEVKYKVVERSLRGSIEKAILKGISGCASPGEVLALMGPSGCGKTTLLNLLSARLPAFATIDGTVTYNDQAYSKVLKPRIGFVTQDDVLFPHLTVKETLTYTALLRLPKTMTKQHKKERAMIVISELGLERCQETMIGGSFVRGVSGGERKRVCIGNEIIINPSLLFLDEPTSGLDSTTAMRIVQILHDVAEAGKTVVTTIHQPSSRLFHKFDKLILLGRGSLLFYGKASEAMAYFSSIGCHPLIAMNPAEFLLDIANGNLSDISIPSKLKDRLETENTDGEPRRSKAPSSTDVQEYLAVSYEKAAGKKKMKLEVSSPSNGAKKSKVQSLKREWGASWIEQYLILFRRGIKERKHEYLSCMRITQVLATAFILGLLWWHSSSSTYKDLHDQTGLLFFISVFWGFFPVFTAIFTFPQERAMLNKERAADMYRLSAYFLARTTSDLPLDLILPVIFLVIVYFMANLNRGFVPFFFTILIVFLCIVAAQGLGLAIGASLMDVKKATTLASVTVMTFMLAGGFFVKRVPPFISWIRYISFNYHTYRLLLKVQYHKVPPTIIHRIHVDNGVVEIGALVGMVFIYRILAYISLRRMKIH